MNTGECLGLSVRWFTASATPWNHLGSVNYSLIPRSYPRVSYIIDPGCSLNPRSFLKSLPGESEKQPRDFSGSPVVRTLYFHCGVQSLVRELRSRKPRGTANNNNIKFKKQPRLKNYCFKVSEKGTVK